MRWREGQNCAGSSYGRKCAHARKYLKNHKGTYKMTATELQIRPSEKLLRTERLPHIWCPGCGIGSTLNCFVRAIANIEMELDKLIVVSGIGCTGRVAGYLKLDSFH